MSESVEQAFERLMTLATVLHLEHKKALECIGQLIDVSRDLRNEAGWDRAAELINELEPHLSSPERAVLHYYLANVWGARRALKHSGNSHVWAWEQAQIEKGIFHLRRALREPGFH